MFVEFLWQTKNSFVSHWKTFPGNSSLVRAQACKAMTEISSFSPLFSQPYVSFHFSLLPLFLFSPPTTDSPPLPASAALPLSWQADANTFQVSSEPMVAMEAWQHLTQQLSKEHYFRWQEPELATQTPAARLGVGASDSINCRQFAQD